MILTWDQVEKDIEGYYSGRSDRLVTPKALKMFLTKFKTKVRPCFKSPMEILNINETNLVKKLKQVGKETEDALTFLRAKYCSILAEEKRESEKEERFLAYKAKLDSEYEEMKKNLESQYNPTFKLKELYAFVMAMQTCGIDSEHTDMEIDLVQLENFRKAVKITSH